MKKILYLLVAIVACACCSQSSTKKTSVEDSVVIVYGFGDLSNDDSVVMPYKKFMAYRDSFAPIYNIESGKTVYMRSKCSCKYGDYIITEDGDTMFCTEDNHGKYVSSEEWHEYYEREE